MFPGVCENVSQIEGPRPSASTAPSIWYADVETPHLKPSGNWVTDFHSGAGQAGASVLCEAPSSLRLETELQRVLAREQDETDAPGMRERQQHALRLEAVGLVVALADHALVRVEVAVLARDELAEAREVLDRGTAVEVVARRLGEPHQLGQADEAEAVQVLVRRRSLIGAARAEAVAAEQRALAERDVVRVAKGEQPVGGARGRLPVFERGERHQRRVAVLGGRREIDVLRRARPVLELRVVRA